VATVDYGALRTSILNAIVDLDVRPLTVDQIEQISWSGSRAHLENVLQQLRRVESGNDVVQYENAYPLCYVRGPEGILIGLAQELS
jgi:hypothetical protein